MRIEADHLVLPRAPAEARRRPGIYAGDGPGPLLPRGAAGEGTTAQLHRRRRSTRG